MERKETKVSEQTEEATAENNNSDIIKDLEEFVTYLKSRPGLVKIKHVSVPMFRWGKEEFVEAVRSMGEGKKEYTDTDIKFTRSFGSGSVTLYAWSLREQICQKVQVGTKVTKTFEIKPEFKNVDIGDYVDKEEPVYEWKCPESLLLEVS